MAVLNKDTSIGDINDVYDRLSSISPSGGGGLSVEVYNCVAGDNSAALNSWLSQLDTSVHKVYINQNNQLPSFDSGIDIPVNITDIDFGNITITKYIGNRGIFKSLVTNQNINLTIRNLYIDAIEDSSTSGASIFSFNATAVNSTRITVNFVNCSLTGEGIPLTYSAGQMCFVTANLYNCYVSYPDTGFYMLSGNYQDTSTFGIYRSYIKSNGNFMPSIYGGSVNILDSYISPVAGTVRSFSLASGSINIVGSYIYNFQIHASLDQVNSIAFFKDSVFITNSGTCLEISSSSTVSNIRAIFINNKIMNETGADVAILTNFFGDRTIMYNDTDINSNGSTHYLIPYVEYLYRPKF